MEATAAHSIRAVSQVTVPPLHPAAYVALSLSVLAIYLWLVHAFESSVHLHQKKDRASLIARQFYLEQRKRRSQHPPRLDAIPEERLSNTTSADV
ncbi:hypothetical protein SDRG_11421 [Saprolegnia diclina VS20]|uniref:Uncharacterized protein n=1 Tax=Saprolegnia diclina (strain VS20) TaxID=1156394 RepID=T0Q8K6_SAPDV|nr:hypothetical protein SDRG_11421 [Saprolegnia diclina VS20]EQC30946.1 hypothetical protein SDRG_11421 [Saprolegnia diclina VS20]|eukprot:XP_008615684.1 hypothetical protein SDRG_11421 [Saprolegnia diclina VS20]